MGAIEQFLSDYAKKETARFHMPGHSGLIEPSDITEIEGADNLYESRGIIAKSEAVTTKLYGTGATVFSAGGSTLGIQAMLMCMKWEGRNVIADRAVHKSFVNACALLDLNVKWFRQKSDSLEDILRDADKPCCVYVTSPDYYGNMANTAALSQICRNHGAKLLVDNAHGAHLAFLPDNLHPIANGADLCCDSAHKTLPALTGCGYVHAADPQYREPLKRAMSIFGTSSPSYLLLESLDKCNSYLAEKIRRKLPERVLRILKLKQNLPHILFLGDEPLHITASLSGAAITETLDKYGIVPEYSSEHAVLFLSSPETPMTDFDRLEEALKEAVLLPNAPAIIIPSIPLPQVAVSMREALLMPQKVTPINKANGQVCGLTSPPCPPCVPLIMPGEVFNEETVAACKKYGIKEVFTVT